MCVQRYEQQQLSVHEFYKRITVNLMCHLPLSIDTGQTLPQSIILKIANN